MIIAGIDEAGRGALAGPVVAGCVIKPSEIPEEINVLIKDSKKLSPKQREKAYEWLVANVDYGVGFRTPEDIDRIGIKKANHEAMAEALESLEVKPDLVQVDGNDGFVFAIKSEDIIKGDEKIWEISAASIVAKVRRDRFMIEVGEVYPEWGFENHKGYGAASHMGMISAENYTSLHRKSYEPLKGFLTKPSLF